MTFAVSDRHGSHLNTLLVAGDLDAPRARVDAIIVPTARPVAYLKEAAAAALDLRCPLVTLHSKKWTNAFAAAAYLDPAVDLIAIDVPDSARLGLPELETSRLLAGTIFERRTDASTKRNLALVLSHKLRWNRIVFLDDDIRVPEPFDLGRAAGLLDAYSAVGLGIQYFPDNSVVCHAFRAGGGRLQTFISGRALAVDMKRNRSFFPNVYNEDWFFLVDAGKRLQQVATVGQVLQYPYDPYRVERARAEEFGDVLAEGIFWVLDQGKPASDGDLGHWRDFLEHRKQFIQQVRSMIAEQTRIDPEERTRMEKALTAALGRCALITPELCVAYMKALAIDHERWQRYIQQIWKQPVQSREEALKSLTMRGEAPLTWYTTTSPAVREPRAARRRQPLDAPMPASLTSMPKPTRQRSAVTKADRAEADANRALAQRAFDKAVACLQRAVALDPAREERLRPYLNSLSGQQGESDGRLMWRRGLWWALAAASPFRPQDSDLVQVPSKLSPPASLSAPTPSTSKDTRRGPQSSEKVRQRPERVGTELEQAFIRLLERFFRLTADDEGMILERLRRQRAGTQFGHDIQFDCTLATNFTVHCHVECKNYKRELTSKDVADKILQMQRYWQSKKVDHFIIVTPRAGVADDLDNLVQYFNDSGGMPFNIQIWGPEEAVEDLFALEPAAYRAIYRTEPHAVDTQAVIDRWTRRLKPVLRLPMPLSKYLRAASLHCMPGEEDAHFEELFSEAIEVEAASSAGLPLGSLRKVLADWVDDPARKRLLLLGEFGDGKSFAGYQLTRRLASEYHGNPEGYFPLRLPLCDLRSAGHPQELLSRRLQPLGATVEDWFSLPDITRTVVILDGFDEMSPQLDNATVAENLRMLAECVRYFSASKLLVTSRTHLFETNREQMRMLEQLQHAEVIRLAPVPRIKRSDHLEIYAKRHDLSDKLKKIRRLYDTIGLAGKPLFLQMIKETLPKLPDNQLDEIILYETSVRDSLVRKVEMLEDKDMLTLQEETIEGMIELLESLAVELLAKGGQPVDLRTFGGDNLDIARVLWKMSEADAGVRQSQDARARFGARSLLKPHPKPDGDEAWPVTFCHRSMSEYFVALAIVRALRNDYNRARDLLSPVILGYEVIRFITLLVDKGDDVAKIGRTLEALARSGVRGTDSRYLGGNAATLAFRIRWQAPRHGWTGLDLSYADLSGADLVKVDFKGSSLRYAILDNADLSHADLTDCDLTGVRIEDTAPVIDIAPGGKEDTVLACYGDGSIREWSLSGPRPIPETLLEDLKGLKTANWGPYGDLVLVDGEKLSLWEITEGGGTIRNEFQIRNGADYVRLRDNMVSFMHADGDQFIALSVDCQAASVNAVLRLTNRTQAIFAGTETALVSLGKGKVRIVYLNSGHSKHVDIPVPDVTAFDIRCGESGDIQDTGEIHLVLADGKGYVSIVRSTTKRSELAPDAHRPIRLHEGSVLAATFLSQHSVATGGADRSLTICDWDHEELRVAYKLKLALRCAGIKTTGVQGDYERRALEALRRKAEESGQNK